MSIATEIQRLQNAKSNIKTAIENKGVEVGNGTIDTYAEKIGEISVGGGLEIERNAKSMTFKTLNFFGKSKVVLNLDNVTTLQNCFLAETAEDTNTIVEHLTVNCLNLITGMSAAFRSLGAYDYTLKHITLNAKIKDGSTWNYCFAGLKALEVIGGEPLNFLNSAMANIFQQDTELKEFRVVENSINKNFNMVQCPNLSDETIQSIIDGLADLTGGTAQTLTLSSTVGNKLTDTQKAIITAKNWTLAY